MVSVYKETLEERALCYEDSGDSDSDSEATLWTRIPETDQVLVAEKLYDIYVNLVSSAVLSAPALSELKFNEYEQVLFVPCSSVNRDDLMHSSARNKFLRALEGIVMPALSEAWASV